MSQGSEVTTRPLYGDHVHTVQAYNVTLDRKDSVAALKPHLPLVVESKASWYLTRNGSPARSQGGFERTFNPNPTSAGNKRTRSFYDIFYERIHYDPAVLRLGQLLNAQTREVHVWNAFFQQRTLLSVVETNGDGVDMDYGAMPKTFAPLQERTFQVSVSVEGPPSIDTTYTFEWDHAVHPYRVIGERIVVLAFPPNPTVDFVERLKWYGTVSTAWSGIEQRMALNDTPKISYTFRAQVLDEELQMFNGVMWGWQNRAFAVPVWNSYTYTSQSAGAGTSTLFVESTALREFRADSLAVIYAGAQLYEAVEILEVQPDRLILKKPLTLGWTRRVPVMPVRTMRMAREINYTGPVANFREVDISLIGEAGEPVAPAPWPVTYKGLPVLNFSPDMAGGISGSYNRNMDWDDGEYSLPYIVDRSGVGTPKQNWQFTWDSYAQIQTFKALLADLCGTQGEFWSSTWAPDMTLVRTIETGSTAMYVSAALHSTMYFDRRGRADLVILLRDGTQLYRGIVSATTGESVVEGSELIVLDQPIDRRILPAQVECISFLTRSRFENEAFEFKWKAQDWASLNAVIKGLTDGV